MCNRKGDAAFMAVGTSWVAPLDPHVVEEIGRREDSERGNEETPIVPDASPSAQVIEEEVFDKISYEIVCDARTEQKQRSRDVAVEVFIDLRELLEQKDSI